jgi:NADH-quinone oxidoreductase subunit L
MLCGEQDMRKMGGLKSNDNYIYNLLISSLAISGIPPFQDFLERRNIMVAFEHNKILWFIASLAS